MNRVFGMSTDLLQFLKSYNHRHSKHFEGSSFILTLAYLADIFGALNELNFQMQEGGKNVIEAEEYLSAFQRKLKLWWHRLENNKFANFPHLDVEVSSSDTAINFGVAEVQRLKPVFTEHLQMLQNSSTICLCYYNSRYKQ